MLPSVIPHVCVDEIAHCLSQKFSENANPLPTPSKYRASVTWHFRLVIAARRFSVVLTVFAQLAVGETEEAGLLLLVPAAVVGVQLVDAARHGLLGAAGLVEVAVRTLTWVSLRLQFKVEGEEKGRRNCIAFRKSGEERFLGQ